jgi:hypothetical protein
MSQAKPDYFFKTSLSLPADLAVMLSNVAKRVGCSQSAVITVLLEEWLPTVSVGLAHFPGDAVARRFVGSSADDIRQVIAAAVQAGRSLGPPDAVVLGHDSVL